MKGHKVQPVSSKGQRLRRLVTASLSGDYMAWECVVCHKPAHVADTGRWRHGEMVGAERYELEETVIDRDIAIGDPGVGFPAMAERYVR